MKKFNITAALLIILVQVQAQKITLRSNGYINTFQKIDNLFFHEYSGQRPTTKTSSIDTIFSKTIMKFDNSFGFNTKNRGEADNVQSKFVGIKRRFSTPYYQHSDGTLQAPTSTSSRTEPTLS